jgi:hypothetical protein
MQDEEYEEDEEYDECMMCGAECTSNCFDTEFGKVCSEPCLEEYEAG